MATLMRGCGGLVLGVMILCVGCEEPQETAPQELTLQDLNDALMYLKKTGRGYPDSVYDLTNLPALQGKVFPPLPEGQYYSLDTEHGTVVIEAGHIPEISDSFPPKSPI